MERSRKPGRDAGGGTNPDGTLTVGSRSVRHPCRPCGPLARSLHCHGRPGPPDSGLLAGPLAADPSLGLSPPHAAPGSWPSRRAPGWLSDHPEHGECSPPPPSPGQASELHGQAPLLTPAGGSGHQPLLPTNSPENAEVPFPTWAPSSLAFWASVPPLQRCPPLLGTPAPETLLAHSNPREQGERRLSPPPRPPSCGPSTSFSSMLEAGLPSLAASPTPHQAQASLLLTRAPRGQANSHSWPDVSDPLPAPLAATGRPADPVLNEPPRAAYAFSTGWSFLRVFPELLGTAFRPSCKRGMFTRSPALGCKRDEGCTLRPALFTPLLNVSLE
ncbi:unnamed protein product [Rangifer tarandus platyrhynchus]|uniref:Uncharacterized protein n=1 Tax=Rangifer tarandus platyrhynchus TaxID=3082113 RepID=A0ABN8YCA0_RANTA|nr:unnamed protein product [Rangifer tarandus platyrhynchus]